MTTYGDPGFHTHVAVGQYLSLLAYHLSTDEVLPFEVRNYGKQMSIYLDELKEHVAESDMKVDLLPIESAITIFNVAANIAASMAKLARKTENPRLADFVNARFRDFERGFVSQGGLPDREFYKHLIFAPGLDTGYV